MPISFEKKKNNLEYSPEKRTDTFYQFCQFKNDDGKYGSRKIIFDESNNIIEVTEKDHSYKTINKYISTHGSNKYKIFPVSNIARVDYPNVNDMIEVRSQMLNNTYTHYGNDTI